MKLVDTFYAMVAELVLRLTVKFASPANQREKFEAIKCHENKKAIRSCAWVALPRQNGVCGGAHFDFFQGFGAKSVDG
jgi:hypothetical protein